MYAPELLDHFEHPRNSGRLQDATSTVRIENPACGDVLELAARIAGDQIQDMHFRAKGCVPAMACASALTELVKGKSIRAAEEIGKEDVIRAVGGLPPASGHAAQLAVDALRAILAPLR